MGFGIMPQGKVGEAYAWQFNTVEEAVAEAERLSIEYNIDVFVIRLLGVFRRQSQYVNVACQGVDDLLPAKKL